MKANPFIEKRVIRYSDSSRNETLYDISCNEIRIVDMTQEQLEKLSHLIWGILYPEDKEKK